MIIAQSVVETKVRRLQDGLKINDALQTHMSIEKHGMAALDALFILAIV